VSVRKKREQERAEKRSRRKRAIERREIRKKGHKKSRPEVGRTGRKREKTRKGNQWRAFRGEPKLTQHSIGERISAWFEKKESQERYSIR